MALLSNTGRFFEVSLRGTKSELPTCGIWGNVRYYPTTALYNSWACVSRNLLRGESRLNRKQNTVCFLCPQLLIIKMEFVPQSNPCWRTSRCSLIYDYLHVKSCQWSPMKEKKTDTFGFFFLFIYLSFKYTCRKIRHSAQPQQVSCWERRGGDTNHAQDEMLKITTDIHQWLIFFL